MELCETLKLWFISLKRAGRWREALRLTGERSKVRVVRFEGTSEAVVVLRYSAGMHVGVAILARGCGDAAGLGISIVTKEVSKYPP